MSSETDSMLSACAVTVFAISGILLICTLSIKGNDVELLNTFLVPWTAVNLVDYFFVRKGRYAIPHFFTPDGIYGTWQARGIAAYLIGFVTMIPFFDIVDATSDKEIFVGYFANRMSGIDIAWLVGLIVAGAVYFVLSRSLDLRAEERGIANIKEGDLASMAHPMREIER